MTDRDTSDALIGCGTVLLLLVVIVLALLLL